MEKKVGRKSQSIDKENLKKVKHDSVQSENDQKVRVRVIVAGVGSLKLVSDDIKDTSDIAPTTDIPLSSLAIIGDTIIETVPTPNGITIEDGGTRFEGPRDDAA